MRYVKNQQGNILVTSLLMLLGMSLLGVGLVNATVQEVQSSSFKTVNSTVFHVTESCTQDGIDWLETLTLPSSGTHQISQNNLNFMMTGSETQAQLNKLVGYSFNCDITSLISKSGSLGTGVGMEVGSGGGYGSTNSSTLRYYYQITSNGVGPKNSARTTNTIVSVWWP